MKTPRSFAVATIAVALALAYVAGTQRAAMPLAFPQLTPSPSPTPTMIPPVPTPTMYPPFSPDPR
jgi:hypothetical protein